MVRSSIEKRSGTSVSRLEMARAAQGRRGWGEVRVPASTANLGSGFDCFLLALQLHLTVRATLIPEADERRRIRSRGEDGSALLPRTAEKNLILRPMRFAAERQGLTLPPMRLAAHNGIPLASGRPCARGPERGVGGVFCGGEWGAAWAGPPAKAWCRGSRKLWPLPGCRDYSACR